MLPAVGFDNEPCLDAYEVGNEGSNGLLPLEFEAAKLAIAEMMP